MRTSESLSNIAAALSKAQGEMPAAPKDAQNDHLRNRYATLGSVITTAAPILARHGLSFVQMPSEAEPGCMALTTRILHESGEWIEDTMRVAVPPGKLSEVQAAGSVISYCRRYALSSALGIVTDDDDGNGTQTAPKPQARPAQPAPRAQAASKPAQPVATEGRASGEVVAINRALNTDFGFKAADRDNAISFVGFLANIEGLASTKDLTDAEARGVLKQLNACATQADRDALTARWADAQSAT